MNAITEISVIAIVCGVAHGHTEIIGVSMAGGDDIDSARNAMARVCRESRLSGKDLRERYTAMRVYVVYVDAEKAEMAFCYEFGQEEMKSIPEPDDYDDYDDDTPPYDTLGDMEPFAPDDIDIPPDVFYGPPDYY